MKGAWLDTSPRRRHRGFCSLSIEKSTNRHRKFFSQGDALMTDGNPPVRPPSCDKKIGLVLQGDVAGSVRDRVALMGHT
jgi:hypothetical protein